MTTRAKQLLVLGLMLAGKAFGQGCDPFGGGLSDASLTNGVTIQLASTCTSTNAIHFDCKVYTNTVYEMQYSLDLTRPWRSITGPQTFPKNTWWVAEIQNFPCSPRLFYRIQSKPISP